jgi:DmsE family decaheme c-type cytochrome
MNKNKQRIWLGGLLPLAVLGLSALVTIAAVPHPATTELFGPAGVEKSRACLECHEENARSLVNTAHTLSNYEGFTGDRGIGCIGCHEGWEAHLDDPSADNIASATEYSLADQASLCSRCHVNQHQIAMTSTDPHASAGLSCTSCHTIHANTTVKLLKDNNQNFCGTCHKSVIAEFQRRSSHPVEAGMLKCTSCHGMAAIADPLLSQGHSEVCQSCHAEKSGPFMHEHPATLAHGVEGGSCMECHEPHGSTNDRLLTSSGKTLCLQCHSVPAKHRTQHSGLGMKMQCVDCHSEIHGSNTSQHMLDPELGIKLFPDCFQSGCHDLNAPEHEH